MNSRKEDFVSECKCVHQGVISDKMINDCYDNISAMSVSERLHFMEINNPIIKEEFDKLTVEEKIDFIDDITMIRWAQEGFNVNLKALKLSGNSVQLDYIIQFFLKMLVSSGAIYHCGNANNIEE